GRREALEVDVLPSAEGWNDLQAGRGALRQREPVELAAAYPATHAHRADGLVCQGTRRSERKAAHMNTVSEITADALKERLTTWLQERGLQPETLLWYSQDEWKARNERLCDDAFLTVAIDRS